MPEVDAFSAVELRAASNELLSGEKVHIGAVFAPTNHSTHRTDRVAIVAIYIDECEVIPI
jgi:hypothetical protein